MQNWNIAQAPKLLRSSGKMPLFAGRRGALDKMAIRKKLPLLIAAFTLVCVTALMATTALLTRASQTENALHQIESTVQERATQLSQWFDNTKGALLTMGSSKQTVDALYTLSSTFNDLDENAKSVLQSAYIAGNPNPIGSRHLLDRAEGDAFYHSEHGKFHKTFRTMMQQNGLYDVFLINRDANIIYTVYKEADFADNLNAPTLAETGLADVYRAAMQAKAGDVFMSDFAPYAPSAGAHALFMATPVVSDMGVVVGVMAIQLPNRHIASIIKSDHAIGASTETYLVDENGKALSDSRKEGQFLAGDTLQNVPATTVEAGTLPLGAVAIHSGITLQSGKTGLAAAALMPVIGAQWRVVTERDFDDVMGEVNALLKTQFIIGALCLIVLTGISFWVSKSITGPIAALNLSIQEVASGTYDTPVPNTDRGDEIGKMATSIDEMRSALMAARNLEEERARLQVEQSDVVERLTNGLGALASGDLTKTIDDAFPHEYEMLRGYYNQTVEKIEQSIAQIASATDGIRVQSHEITRASEELAHRTEVQAATLEQTAAAMDEMTASVKSAADGVQEVETIVGEARKQADQSDTIVKEAVSAMSEIEKSSLQISQIIAVIDDIAFQTNLLALNAGVEAARAGDAGRGFAVVASEVGALAQRASTAAKEIKTLISTSAHHVELGVERVKQAGTALQKIAQRVTHISTLTSSMATGASEQSIGLHEINVGVTQLDQATQKNAAMAEEANAASQLMANGMQELGQLIGRFKLKDAMPDLGGAAAFQNQQFSAIPAGVPDLGPFEEVAGGLASGDDTPPEFSKIAVNARGVWQDF